MEKLDKQKYKVVVKLQRTDQGEKEISSPDERREELDKHDEEHGFDDRAQDLNMHDHSEKLNGRRGRRRKATDLSLEDHEQRIRDLQI